jgi:hypothetical protein
MTEDTKVAPVPLRIPGFSQGVRPNAAMRRLVMNAPICPFSQKKYTKDQFGNMTPVDEGTQNCQLEGGTWWITCEERGHDPYFTTKVRYTIEDVYETDEAGREIKTGEQRIAHREYRPNLVSVPMNRRINNGRGVLDSMEKKGRRRLKDAVSKHSPAGYIEVCQFRNCEKPINPNYHSIPLGDYCSREHFQLSAANEKNVKLHILGHGLNTGSEERIANERDQQLAQATWLRTDEK